MKIKLASFKKIFTSPRTLHGINPDRDWRIMLFVFIAINAFSMVLNVHYYKEINSSEDFVNVEDQVITRSPINISQLESVTDVINARAVRYVGLIRQPVTSVDPS